MMDQTVLFISITSMFMMAMLLIGVIYSRLHWSAKAFLMVSSLIIVAMDHTAFTRSLGWPVADELPNRFKLLGAVINEPSKIKADKGAIYVWYVTQGVKEPRSVEIPYSKDMHKKMAKAQEMLGKGQQVYMGRSGIGEDGEPLKGKPGNGTENGKGNSGQSTYRSQGPIDFIPPPDTLAPKD